MYILLLFGVIPFLLLLAGLGLLGVMVIVATIVEFPLIALVTVSLGLLVRQALPSLSKKQDALCQPM